MSWKTVVIANPRSGGGATERRWGEFAAVLGDTLGTFEHRFTRDVGDGTRLAREALAEGFELVVAMGGDGTVSEVASGFFDGERPTHPEAVLGILPGGTGGDFLRTLGIPRTFAEAARGLRGEATRRIDVGLLEYTLEGGKTASRHFTNIASFGLGGVVDRIVNSSKGPSFFGLRPRAFGGKLAYLAATLQGGLQYKNQRVKVVLDDGEPQYKTIQSVAVANGRYFGGGMHIAPGASVEDGRFDVITLGDMTPLDFVKRGYKVYLGTHIGSPKIECQRAKVVRAWPIDPKEAVLLDVDGEAPGQLPATFRILPGALRVKVEG